MYLCRTRLSLPHQSARRHQVTHATRLVALVVRAQRQHAADEAREMLHRLDQSVASPLAHEEIVVEATAGQQLLHHPVHRVVVETLQFLVALAPLQPALQQVLVVGVAERAETEVGAARVVALAVELRSRKTRRLRKGYVEREESRRVVQRLHAVVDAVDQPLVGGVAGELGEIAELQRQRSELRQRHLLRLDRLPLLRNHARLHRQTRTELRREADTRPGTRSAACRPPPPPSRGAACRR